MRLITRLSQVFLLCTGVVLTPFAAPLGSPTVKASGGNATLDREALQLLGAALPSPGAASQLASAHAELPLSFEANTGQADAGVSFLARGGGYDLSLTDREMILTFGRSSRSAGKVPDTLRVQFQGSSGNARTVGESELPGKVNYFIGNDSRKWRTNVRTFAQVRRKAIYPGIDLVLHGNARHLEYDFIVAPGARVADIQLRFGGTEPEVASTGELELRTREGVVRQRAPFVYQDVSGVRTQVAGRWVRTGAGLAGFAIGTYDRSQPLVIDPVLSYSTYLGGPGLDYANGIATDGQGYSYITGYSSGPGFPVVGGLPGGFMGPGGDVFISKMSPDGRSLVFSTYLGGSGVDTGMGIAIDPNGAVYVCGITFSTNFPMVNAFQSATPPCATCDTHQGDAFAAKLAPAGNSLVFSTYLGGSLQEQGLGIAADSVGNAYIVGDTVSSNFPVLNALQPIKPYFEGYDGFVTKLTASGGGVYSTYWGGAGGDSAQAVAADNAGNAYVGGYTAAANFPMQNPYQGTIAGGADAFISKFSPNGSTLLYSTYFGGAAGDQGTGIALGPAGNIFITGFTNSVNLPVVNGYQMTKNGIFDDLFVTKFSLTGNALDFSTYLGGSNNGNDFSSQIVVDGCGRAVVGGATRSTDFPTKNAIQATASTSGRTPIVTKFLNTGSDLVYSTYVGGPQFVQSSQPTGARVGVDRAGNAYVAGGVQFNLVTTPGAFQTSPPGGPGNFNAFVLRITDARPLAEFDGDFKSDRVVFRPSSGIWHEARSSGAMMSVQFGLGTDVDVSADYDGDNKADVAVWRPSEGNWYVLLSQTGALGVTPWGQAGDVPLPGDVDGDCRADQIVWRPFDPQFGQGTWYARLSTTGSMRVVPWGQGSLGDIPFVGDWDGDGKSDFAVWRPDAGSNTGTWHVLFATGNYTSLQWGAPGDQPLIGDWDADGKSDFAIWRPSTGVWWIVFSGGGYTGIAWGGGSLGDVPISGDVDGDGKSDITVWRPSSGVWYSMLSSGGTAFFQWGADGDRPIGRGPGS